MEREAVQEYDAATEGELWWSSLRIGGGKDSARVFMSRWDTSLSSVVVMDGWIYCRHPGIWPGGGGPRVVYK